MREYLTSKVLIIAVFILPILVALIIPTLIQLVFSNVPTAINPQVTKFLPPVLRQALVTMGPQKALYWYLYSVITLPMFLLLPITSVIVLASDSFAGEKERRTMESLLSEPLSMSDLFVGKVLAPVIVALAVTWVSVTIYWTLALHFTSALGLDIGPGGVWYSAMLILVPAITLSNVALVSWISSLSKGFKESQQVSGVLILPVAALVLTSATGNLVPTVGLILELSAVYAVLFVVGTFIWSRLIKPGRLID